MVQPNESIFSLMELIADSHEAIDFIMVLGEPFEVLDGGWMLQANVYINQSWVDRILAEERNT